MNLPNFVTAIRLVLAPFIFQAIVYQEHRLALFLFSAAAVTDGLDGFLARRFGTTTAIGAYLDPIADKVLLSGSYVALAFAGNFPWWMVGLVFGRDLLILAAVGVALTFTRVRYFPPSVWGKLSTFFQIVAAVGAMCANALENMVVTRVATALIWPAAAMTIWSGIDYGRRAWKLAADARMEH